MPKKPAALPSPSSSGVPTDRSSSVGWKTYNRMQMQPASSPVMPETPLAVLRLGGEKPHQGFSSRNPALYQGPTVCNSTTALGLRGQAELNRVGSRSTGKERDQESGNDYFGARYYASTMGRFMSPDWSAKEEPVPYAKLDNPQTLNLYSYMRNNPLAGVDPDGHCDWCDKLWNSAKQSLQNLAASATTTLAGLVKTYQTYTKPNDTTGKTYSGRTSGTRTPEQNVAARDAQHQVKNAEGYGPAKLDKSSSNPDAIRGQEQLNIKANGGAQSEGGTSGNAINGVSPANPKADQYINAAQSEFGTTPAAPVTPVETPMVEPTMPVEIPIEIPIF